ncbi:polycystic kidney disease protein 1-like 3 [Mya arenaria]|uniref:polycystic kidney disease protein 1-like 3 n=1 Tax=Mya arenaria TaxID=6604 RepID=UPI0022DEE802|nr:polycystic kidney disease protein 1-like 3 [Mya arenaria]
MEPQTQASPLDQLKTQVPVPTEPARKAPPVRLRVSRSFNAQGDKKQEERQNVLKARNAPSVPQKPQRVCRENDAQADKKEMEQQNFKEVFGTTTTGPLTETAQTTPGVAGIEQASYQRSEDSPRQQSEQNAVFFISPNVTVEKGFPTEVSDGPAMGDMAGTAAVTADIPETEGVASQRRTDTLNHQVGQTALVVIPPDVTVYKGSPTKDSDGQAMGIMTESTVVTAESPADIAGTEDVVSQRSADTPKHQKEQTALFAIPPDVTANYSDDPAMGIMAERTFVTADIAGTEDVVSQRSTDTTKHQKEQTALIVIPSDVTAYKRSPTNDSDGPAMGIMAESTFVTADIAGTEDVVSQRSADTPKHLKEQTALIVIPPDVTAYKETPTKDSDGQAMSDMTESTDVTGGIAETKEVASQRRIDTPKHQSEHTALDVIPPDVTKYKGTPTKEHSGDIQINLLRRLGLEERFEHNLITVQEAMIVHTNQPRGEKWSLSQLPWTMLRNIIAVDSTARDCIYTQETENTAETLKSEGQSVFDVRSIFGKDVSADEWS